MLAGLPLSVAPAFADDFFWDGGSPGDNSAGGGSGEWRATEQPGDFWVANGLSRNWSDGGNVAIFGGTAGTVTIVAGFGVRPDELVFNVGGYTITRNNPGGFLAGVQAITVNAGTTTIATPLDITANLTITGPGELVLATASNLAGTTIVTGGATVTIAASIAMGPATIALDDGKLRTTIDTTLPNAISVFGSGTVSAAAGRTLTLNGVMSVLAGATVTFGSAADTGTVLLNGSFIGAGNANLVVAGGTLRDGGFLSAFGPSGLVAIQSTTVNAGATLDLSAIPEAAIRNLMGAGNVMISPLNGVKPSLSLMVGEGETVEFAGVISGSGNVQAVGFPFVFPPTNVDGTVILSGNNTYTGDTYICDCTVLQLGNGGASGTVAGNVVNAGTLAFNRSDTHTFAGIISDDPLLPGSPGKLVKNGSGNVVLTAASTYTGGTTVNSGGLIVNGSIVGLTTVNGGFVGGSGTFGALQINAGGSLSPGNSIGTVTGNLTMAAGSTYVVEVSPTDADRTNVVAGGGGAGNAVLTGASVVATYAPGTYVERRYTILNAAGGLGGTTFTGVAGAAPLGFAHSLAYDANNVYLVLEMGLAQYSGLNRNQQAVANAISGYFTTNGSILADFGALSPAGLTLVSGETGTGSVQAGFLASDRFVEIITDPFVAGRGGDLGAGSDAGEPAAFAEEQASARGDRLSSDAAYAALLGKQATHSADIVERAFVSRWKGWGAAYGATSTFAGNTTIGSQDSSHRLFGLAAGADYRLGDSLFGFALGGAGSSFALENGLGGGASGSFNAGLYGSQQFGDFYVTGALAYGFHAARHSRTVGADTLSARFNAHSLSARVEGGYRFEMAAAAVTPYAAVQGTSLFLPAYAETSSGNAVFALNYAKQTASAARFEFGAKVDRSFAMGDALLTLRGRAAWVHNAAAARSITAGFQQLPGTSFSIFGAAQARNAALVSAAAEIAWPNGFAASLSAQGEFAPRATAFAASAKLSYRW